MKIYRVCDDCVDQPTITDLAELGKLFLKLSKKYEGKNDWFWVYEEEI